MLLYYHFFSCLSADLFGKGSLRQDFCREALVWRSLSHHFILPLLGIFEDGSQLYLVSPFMTNKTLRQWRDKHTPAIPDLHKMVRLSYQNSQAISLILLRC